MAAVKLTITETRPNTTVDFMRDEQDFIQYIQKYNHFRKRNESAGWVTAPDLLTRTVMHTYTSKDDLITFINDPLVAAYTDSIDLYNSTNGIARSVIQS